MEGWTFLTNHTHVLLSIASDPDIRLRDVARRVGITERAAQRIVGDLIEGGYLASTKVGRRNRYTLNSERELRHPIEQHCRVASLIALIADGHRGGEQSQRTQHDRPVNGQPNPDAGEAGLPLKVSLDGPE